MFLDQATIEESVQHRTNGIAVPELRRGRHSAPEPATTTVPRPVSSSGTVNISRQVMVEGRRCPVGHFNDPASRYCAACGRAMSRAPLELVHDIRPPVGVLVVDDGTRFPLARNVVVGASPQEAVEVEQGASDPLRLVGPGISAVHARLVLRGWDVLVVAEPATAGTAVGGPEHGGFSAVQPNTPTVILPGSQVRVGDRTLTFESHSTPAQAVATRHRARKHLASRAPARDRVYPLTVATASCVAALALLVYLGMSLHVILFIPSLAASMALIAGAPMLPLAQPRNVIGGQLISGAVGLAAYWVAGGSMWAAAVAGGLALGMMLLTRTLHAPAAATAAIAALVGPAPVMFLGFLLLATIVLVLVGIVGTQLSRVTRYPKYWW